MVRRMEGPYCLGEPCLKHAFFGHVCSRAEKPFYFSTVGWIAFLLVRSGLDSLLTLKIGLDSLFTCEVWAG